MKIGGLRYGIHAPVLHPYPGEDIPAFSDARVREVLRQAAHTGLVRQDDRERLPVLLIWWPRARRSMPGPAPCGTTSCPPTRLGLGAWRALNPRDTGSTTCTARPHADWLAEQIDAG
ncbi:hypothetical protein STSP_41570 [Streptomyces jeddahensis]|uniref:Uncharacterized protein n=1 Tax=Streptomyces jeddahensis TaxID=1716141 RepID=A0A177HPE0_9ACTN|nr:hypothetical protein STSP_41570 [Streptomyces jeddahensis]